VTKYDLNKDKCSIAQKSNKKSQVFFIHCHSSAPLGRHPILNFANSHVKRSTSDTEIDRDGVIKTDVTPALSSRDFVARVRDFIVKSRRTEHSSSVQKRECATAKNSRDAPCHTGDFARAIKTRARKSLV